jgi:L-2-hydroxyglutarate oxidase LhgO
VVVGAGVVGLAVARELALAGREVWVIEGATDIGTGTSSRNSEVVHAGIYYPQGSLKAKLCVEGRHALYSYCEENGVPFKKVGKLIVATNSNQVPVLENLMRAGEANGVTDLRLMEASEAKELEPHVHCVKALWSPSSGILDTHSFMLTLQKNIELHSRSIHQC